MKKIDSDRAWEWAKRIATAWTLAQIGITAMTGLGGEIGAFLLWFRSEPTLLRGLAAAMLGRCPLS